MFTVRHALLVSVLAFPLASQGSVIGQDASGLGYGYLFGYGATNTPAIRSFVPAPPYFALHPPVYYGKRYTRPYGDSPFASWPQLRSAPGYQPRPAAPYAPMPYPQMPCSSPDCQGGYPVEHAVAVPQPLVIDNPHYAAAVASIATVDAQPQHQLPSVATDLPTAARASFGNTDSDASIVVVNVSSSAAAD